MNITKKTAFGATAAVAALVVAGAAAPAMASEDWGHSSGDTTSTSYSKWSSYASHKSTETNTVIAPDVDVLNGDILNGNAVGSGNTTPILSGNDTAVGNVSDVGNISDVGNDNLSGNDVSSEVSDLVDNVTHTTVSDVVDVNDILGDVGGWVNLEGMFED